VHDKQVRRRRAVLGLLVVISLILLTAYFGESSSSPLHSVQRGIVAVLFVADLGHDRSREAKLTVAQELFREAAREAAEAGLKNTEILELAQKIIKGK